MKERHIIMKTFEKKVARFVFNNRLKTNMLFYGVINSVDFFGNSYFFGRLSDNFFDKNKFKEVNLSRIIKDYMINPRDDKLVKPDFSINFSIAKGNRKLELINFKMPNGTVNCNYNYYKLFEKDTCYILDAKNMLCLYDENKSLIGFISKVVNR